MPLTRLAYLFQKYFSKTATPEEAAEFMHLADQEENGAELRALMEKGWTDFTETEPVFDADQSEAMLRAVLGEGAEVSAAEVLGGHGSGAPGEAESSGAADGGSLRQGSLRQGSLRQDESNGEGRGKTVWMGWRRLVAAAVIAGGLGWGGWWWAHQGAAGGGTAAHVGPQPVPKEVKAGGNTAVLVLGNGSTVVLDSMQTGVVTTQGKTEVMKLAGGRLSYAGGSLRQGSLRQDEYGAGAGEEGGSGEAAVLYNTVRTPRGGQYQVTLADGSRVWLNAATALRFPTAFTGKERVVELTGEAYFEISPDKNKPFRVKIDQLTVDVLGTHFNVMAYPDEESVHTTLLTGAVRVQEGGEARLLKPGQEARWSPDAKDIMVAAVDTDQVVSWKNGLFQFDGATLETVMRQVARWYDVEVRYEGTVPKHFSGLISRNESLADVLHVLDKAGKTQFSLEGRTVVVKPK